MSKNIERAVGGMRPPRKQKIIMGLVNDSLMANCKWIGVSMRLSHVNRALTYKATSIMYTTKTGRKSSTYYDLYSMYAHESLTGITLLRIVDAMSVDRLNLSDCYQRPHNWLRRNGLVFTSEPAK